MNLNFLTNPVQRAATGKRLPSSELETVILYGSDESRARILAKASPNGHALASSAATYHIIEALCRESDPSSLAELVFSIRRHLAATAQSRYGHLVLLALLKNVPAVVKSDLVESLVDQLGAVAVGEFGHKIVCQLVSRENPQQERICERVHDVLVPRFTALATDQYGQSVVAASLRNATVARDKKFQFFNNSKFGNSNNNVAAASLHLFLSSGMEDDDEDENENQQGNNVVSADVDDGMSFWAVFKKKHSDLIPVLWQKNYVQALIPVFEREEINKFGTSSCAGSQFLLLQKKTRDEKWLSEISEKIMENFALPLLRTYAEKKNGTYNNSKNNNSKNKNKKKKNTLNQDQDQDEDEDDDKGEEEEQEIILRSSSFFIPVIEKSTFWRNKILDILLVVYPSLLLEWSTKHHALAGILEALCRSCSDAESQVKAKIVPLLLLRSSSSSSSNSSSSLSLEDMIQHRYAAFPVRALAKRQCIPMNSESVKTLVSQASTLCTTPNTSIFLQCLLPAAKTEMIQSFINLHQKQDQEKKQQQQNQKQSKKQTQKKGDQEDSASSSSSSGLEELIFDSAGSRLIQALLDSCSASTSASKEEKLFISNIFSLVAKASSIPQQQQQNKNRDGEDEDEVENDYDQEYESEEVTLGRETALLLSAEGGGEEEQQEQQPTMKITPSQLGTLSKVSTSPNGTHVLQSLIRIVDDESLVELLEKLIRIRVAKRFTGLPALARNKYGCHIVVALLRELKKRSATLEAYRKKAMNTLKEHVHFLALAASTGRHVFDEMCVNGSAELSRLMKQVVSMKCEAYLKGDPFLDGDDNNNNQQSGGGGGGFGANRKKNQQQLPNRRGR